MYPTDLDVIDWEVKNFRYIISNIKNIYIQLGPLPLRNRTFDTTDTKLTRWSSNNEHSNQPSIRKSRKRKRSKVQNESTLIEWRIQDTEELINFSGHKVWKHPKHAFLQWEMRGFCFSDCLHKAYHINYHSQDCKSSITKHITKVRSGQKWRTWQGAKPVYLPRNRVPPDKPRGNTPPLPPLPYQIPIAKTTPPCAKGEYPPTMQMTWVYTHSTNVAHQKYNKIYQAWK